MRYEVEQVEGGWAVNASEDGERYVAVFDGHDPETMAREYAAWKNGEVFVIMRRAR